MNQKRSKTSLLFDEDRAKNYDRFSQIWMPNYDVFCDWIPSILANKYLRRGDKILAVGCGTANEIISLLHSNEVWHITGIDPSLEMLKVAKEKLKAYPTVSLIHGYVNDLPRIASFDGATLLLVLHFLPDDGQKLSLLKAISGRLHRGAPLVIADIFGDKTALESNLNFLVSTLSGKVNPTEILERQQKIRNTIHYISEKRLVQLLQAAGFSSAHRLFQSTIYGGWICTKL